MDNLFLRQDGGEDVGEDGGDDGEGPVHLKDDAGGQDADGEGDDEYAFDKHPRAASLSLVKFEGEHLRAADHQSAKDGRQAGDEPKVAGPVCQESVRLNHRIIGQRSAEQGGGRRGQTAEGFALFGVDVELGQTQRGEHGEHQGDIANRAVGPGQGQHHSVEDEGRQHAETHQVGQGIQLFAQIAVGAQGAGGKAVAEIEDDGGQHEIERPVEAQRETGDDAGDAANQIQASDGIGNVFGQAHNACQLFSEQSFRFQVRRYDLFFKIAYFSYLCQFSIRLCNLLEV